MQQPHNDKIAALQAQLAGLTGPARCRPMLELAQAYSERHWRSGLGQPAGRPDLDAAIDAMEEAYGLLKPDDPWRGRVSNGLGYLLAMRHGTYGGAGHDLERGIHCLEESFNFPLPAANMAMSRVSLGSLYLNRAAQGLQTMQLSLAGFRAGAPPTSRDDTDRAVNLLRLVLDGEAVSNEVSNAARTLLDVAEALRDLLAGLGSDSGLLAVDFSRVAKAMTVMQNLQGSIRDAGGTAGLVLGGNGLWQAGRSTMAFMDADALASLPPLDRPLPVYHGPEPPAAPVVTDRPVAAPIDLDGLRSTLPALLSKLARLMGVGEASSDTSADAPTLAAALLCPDGPQPPGDAVDELVGLATTIVHSDASDPVAAGIDHFVLAVSLNLRNRLDNSGWEEDEGFGTDRLAGAESLLAAAEMLSPDHPVAVLVLKGLGAFLDDRQPLGGVPGDLAARFAGRADAVAAAQTHSGPHRAVVEAISWLCRSAAATSTGYFYAVPEFERAVAVVPADYPWLPRLRAAMDAARSDPASRRGAGRMLADGNVVEAFEALEAAASSPADSPPTVAEVAAAARAVGADALVYLHLVDTPGGNVGVVLLDPATAQLDLLATLDAPIVTTGLPAVWGDRFRADVVDQLVARLDPEAAPHRVLVAGTGPLGQLSWSAARLPEGRYVTDDLMVSFVSSGRQVMDLAKRNPIPVTDHAVFIANPRNDRESATVEAIALRRIFYPRSIGLGQTVEQVHGIGIPTEVLAHLPSSDRTGASLLDLGCTLKDAGTLALELANLDSRSGS